MADKLLDCVLGKLVLCQGAMMRAVVFLTSLTPQMKLFITKPEVSCTRIDENEFLTTVIIPIAAVATSNREAEGYQLNVEFSSEGLPTGAHTIEFHFGDTILTAPETCFIIPTDLSLAGLAGPLEQEELNSSILYGRTPLETFADSLLDQMLEKNLFIRHSRVKTLLDNDRFPIPASQVHLTLETMLDEFRHAALFGVASLECRIELSGSILTIWLTGELKSPLSEFAIRDLESQDHNTLLALDRFSKDQLYAVSIIPHFSPDSLAIRVQTKLPEEHGITTEQTKENPVLVFS